MYKLHIKRQTILFFISIVIIYISGCAKQAAMPPALPASEHVVLPAPKVSHKPIWIDQESAQYPQNKFLTGIGSGSTQGAAEDAARAAVAKIFSAEIQATSSSLRQYVKLSAGIQTTERFDLQFSSSVSVATNKVLQNVKIVERWYDEQQKLNFALAAMDRNHSAALIRSQITDLDREIEVLRQQQVSTTDQIETMRILHKTMKLLLKRAVYNTDLRVVSVNADGIDSSISLSNLEQELQQHLSNNFQIGVKVSGKHSENIRTSIIEVLTKEGFTVNKNNQQSDLNMLVDVNVSFENSDLPKYKFVRWRLSLKLKNAKTEKILGGFEREGKEAHKTFKEAEKRAIRAIKKAIEVKIGPEIISFIFLEGK